jgi:hypothetical protein
MTNIVSADIPPGMPRNQSGMNSLVHPVLCRAAEGRRPHPPNEPRAQRVEIPWAAGRRRWARAEAERV